MPTIKTLSFKINVLGQYPADNKRLNSSPDFTFNGCSAFKSNRVSENSSRIHV